VKAEPASVVVGAPAALPAPAPVSEASGRTSGPAPLEQLREPPPLAPSPDRSTGPLPDLTEDGLPRRVRKSAAPEPLPPDEPDETLSQRPPEQTRAMMSAFQSAFARGRRDAQATAAEPEQET
jgi:hypothetical protein